MAAAWKLRTCLVDRLVIRSCGSTQFHSPAKQGVLILLHIYLSLTSTINIIFIYYRVEIIDYESTTYSIPCESDQESCHCGRSVD